MSIEQLSSPPVISDKPKESTYDLLKDAPGDASEVPEQEEELKPEDDLLKEEKPKKEEKKKEEEVEVPEENEEKLKEEAVEDIQTPPARKKILEKYPNIFKDFPYLQSAFYREQEFTEMFGTLEDAKQVKERAETLQGFEEHLFKGSSQEIFQAVRQESPEAFGRMVDNILPSIYKVDPSAYLHIVGNMTRETVRALIQSASAQGISEEAREALGSAAKILHQWAFGSTNWQEPGTYGKPVQQGSEENKIAEERAQLVQEKFESAKDDLEGRINNRIKSTISQNIDPRNQMSSYVKSKAIEDCLDSLDNAMENDARFKKQLDLLWQDAFDKNFSRDSVSKIDNAIISKARALLRDHISQARNNALKGTGKRMIDDEPQKGPVERGRPTSSSNSGNKLSIPKGMSTKDFLMSD